MADKVKAEDDRTVSIALQPFRSPIVDAAAVLEVSAEGAPHPRYRAGYTLPVCEHKHRSAQAAARCALKFSIGVARNLKRGQEVLLANPDS